MCSPISANQPPSCRNEGHEDHDFDKQMKKAEHDHDKHHHHKGGQFQQIAQLIEGLEKLMMKETT